MRSFRWPRPQSGWVPGNEVRLLENGEQYYPAVFGAIRAAKREVLIETFILFEDKVGFELQQVLIEAAGRGVQVDLTVDGWGSADLSRGYIAKLAQAGVKVRIFDPRPRFLGMRLHMFRRMHRKIVVVDGEIAFVGGINFSADHLGDFGPEAKQDYSVSVRGPLVPRIRRFALEQIGPEVEHRLREEPQAARAGDMDTMLVARDNRHHRDSIERQYRAAIRVARKEVLIANAYFFPGYRLLKEMRRAVQRGCRVRLVLQGQPDMKIVKHAAELLHGQLTSAGVEIHEYCKRPLHGKVALVDDNWATVGSSNLDPLSLSLNLEANVMMRSRKFNAELRANLDRILREDCHQLQPGQVLSRRTWWRVLLDTLAYHLTRRFPAWAGYLPAHSAPLKLAVPEGAHHGEEGAWRPR
jgi:cardiolipin synthase